MHLRRLLDIFLPAGLPTSFPSFCLHETPVYGRCTGVKINIYNTLNIFTSFKPKILDNLT